MKKRMNRALSVLLVLAMVIGFFAMLAPVADAATFSYNTGKRGTTCTSLSSQAKSYYTSSYSYSTLSAKSAYSLKSSLKTLMTNTHSYKTTYNNLKTYTKYSDANAGSSSRIVDFYTSATYSGTWDSGSTWNREHVWPQSLGSFTTSNCGSDLHHLRPTDPKVNSTRNNLPYGEVSGSYKTATTSSGIVGGYYTSSYFEPLDNVKGDVARILLYNYIRWGESNLTDVIQSVDVLLQWCKQDPVDAWEMGRNDVVQNIQGNRNVFIDYPEYAWLIFGKSVPSMTTPSGNAGGGSGSGTTTYTVKASTNNSNYGTVSVSGYTITCTPKSGYAVSSATLLSGSATATMSGNKIYVTPTSDCSIRVNFAATSSGGSDSGSTSGTTFTKVTSTSKLTSGKYVLVVKVGTGSNKGSSTYYALKAQSMNTSYVAAASADSFMGGSAPSTIKVSDSTIIWTLSGSASGFTLANNGKYISGSSNYLYYGSSKTTWKASDLGSTWSIKNGSRYMALRPDLVLGSNGCPRFRCNSSAISTNYQFYLYKQG